MSSPLFVKRVLDIDSIGDSFVETLVFLLIVSVGSAKDKYW